MAFCKYCGRKLEEGEVCNCVSQAKDAPQTAPLPSDTEQAAVVPKPSAAPTFNSEQAAEAGQKAKLIVRDIWSIVKGIYTNPSQAIPDYVQNGSVLNSGIILALQAVLSALFAVFVVGKINKLIGLGGGFTEAYKFSGLMAFILTFLYSAIVSIVLAALYLAGVKIVKGKFQFSNALAVSSVKAVAVFPFIIFSYILVALNPAAGIVTFYFGFIFAIFYLVHVLDRVDGISTNKAIYLNFIIIVLFLLFFALFAKGVATSYVPSSIKSLVSGKGITSLLEEMLY